MCLPFPVKMRVCLLFAYMFGLLDPTEEDPVSVYVTSFTQLLNKLVLFQISGDTSYYCYARPRCSRNEKYIPLRSTYKIWMLSAV